MTRGLESNLAVRGATMGVALAVLVGLSTFTARNAAAEQGPCPDGTHVAPGTWDDLNSDGLMQRNEVGCDPDAPPTTQPSPTPTTKPKPATTTTSK